jgi:predicted dienelactone hydrolase
MRMAVWAVGVLWAGIVGAACGKSDADGKDKKQSVPDASREAGESPDGLADNVSAPETMGEIAVEAGQADPGVETDLDVSSSDPGSSPPDLLPDEPAAPDLTGQPEQIADSGGPVMPMYDPSGWGPFKVGTRSYNWYDQARARYVPCTVWYPAIAEGEPNAQYLLVVKGKAYVMAEPDLTWAPYPIVLFSHGFRGKAEQSIHFTEYIASHGYVVAAMDHVGNTLTDFTATDESTAKVALERPFDVAYAYNKIVTESAAESGLFPGLVDPTRVAATGHSFGGYTALMVGGGEVDVSAAQAACAAGTPADIFCDYVIFWEAGKTEKLEPALVELDAVVALTPGGSSAFGEPGLAKVSHPVLEFGGTLDETTPIPIEIDPIYEGLPPPKMQVIIEGAGHMSFTNICDLPEAELYFKDFCDLPGLIQNEQVFIVANTISVAFLNLYVRKQAAAAFYLTPEYIDAKYGYAQIKSESIP